MEYRVYFSKFIVIFFGIPFIGFTASYPLHKILFLDLFEIVLFGFLFFMTLFHSFFPIWKYDANGFEKNIFSMRKRKYAWEDICEIRMVSSDAIWFITKSKAKTTLGKLFNKNYESHLLRVTNYIKDRNPNVKTDSFFQSQYEKLRGNK
jgi:hypothetical protein